MRILITNDDGIGAEGSTSCTRSREAMIRRRVDRRAGDEPDRRLALDDAARAAALPADRTSAPSPSRGTPTDCVIMGVRHFMLDHPPDLVLSGVNHGSNLAEDVTYSGTIAAAMEGTLLGIRSIAMSQTGGSLEEGNDPLGDAADARARRCREAARRRLADGHRDQHQLSRRAPPDEVTGIEVTRQGRRDQALLNIDKRNDPWGTPYFWFGFERPPSTIVAGHRPWRHRRTAHLGDAAVPQPHATSRRCRGARRRAFARLRASALPAKRAAAARSDVAIAPPRCRRRDVLIAAQCAA